MINQVALTKELEGKNKLLSLQHDGRLVILFFHDTI
jgi:hypothetical protein